jgi:hypothetical protein
MTALRSAPWTHVEHGTGEREFYGIGADPCQLRNRGEAPDPLVLKALSTGAGTSPTAPPNPAARSKTC